MKFYLLILFAVFSLLGCSVNDEEVSPRDQSIELLNYGRYEEAVGLLEPLHAEDPNNDEIRLLLASSYSGLVELDFITIFDRMKPYFLVSNNRAIGSNHSLTEINADNDATEKDENNSPSREEFESIFTRFLVTLADHADLLSNLPYLDKAKRIQLEKATHLLAGIGEDSEYYVRSRLYNATINFLMFTSVTRQAIAKTAPVTEVSFSAIICNLNPQELFINIPIALDYLQITKEQIASISSIGDIRVSHEVDMLDRALKTITDTQTKYQAIAANSFIWIDSLQSRLCQN